MKEEHLRQRLDIGAQEKFCRDIESVPEEQVAYIQHPSMSITQIHNLMLSLQRPTIRNCAKQRLDMTLKAMQITHTIPCKLRSNQLPTGMPLGAIRGKDAITEKVLPLLMEQLALAKVAKLCRQQGLYILWVRGEDDAQVKYAGFRRP